jgi:hypothetical protein
LPVGVGLTDVPKIFGKLSDSWASNSWSGFGEAGTFIVSINNLNIDRIISSLIEFYQLLKN